jgi:hypothetical protein
MIFLLMNRIDSRDTAWIYRGAAPEPEKPKEGKKE